MKRITVISTAALFILHFSGHAQTTKPQMPVKTGNEWKMPSDIFQRAKTYSTDLQRKLNLDSMQTKKVYDIFLANTKPLDEISVATVSDKEKIAMRKSNQAAFNEKMKNILSVSQYQKYLQMIPATR